MRIEITSRSFEITDSVREYIEERLNKLTRYFDRLIECHVILKVERFMHTFEITLHGNGFDLFAEAHDEDLYVAFDAAAGKMERQVRKHKDKVRSRKARRPDVQPLEGPEDEDLDEMVEEYEEPTR
jgi:putative sigma-54 modulation protein